MFCLGSSDQAFIFPSTQPQSASYFYLGNSNNSLICLFSQRNPFGSQMDYLDKPFIPPKEAKYLLPITLVLLFPGHNSSFLPGFSHHSLLRILPNYLSPIPGLHDLVLPIAAWKFTTTDPALKHSSRGSKYIEFCKECWSLRKQITNVCIWKSHSRGCKANCSLGRRQQRTNVPSCNTFTLLPHTPIK